MSGGGGDGGTHAPEMDAQLLARLPDAAKLNILRQLGQQAAGISAMPRQQQHPHHQPRATPAAFAATGGDVPQLLAGRSLVGGLAIVDGFLTTAEVQASSFRLNTSFKLSLHRPYLRADPSLPRLPLSAAGRPSRGGACAG